MAQSSGVHTPARAKGYAPITARCGEDLSISLTIKESDDTVEDLTGDTLEWVLYRQGSKLNSLTKTTSDGITVTDAANGLATIDVTSANTDDLEPGIYHHELWLKDSSGDYEPIFKGTIRLLPGRNFGTVGNAFEES